MESTEGRAAVVAQAWDIYRGQYQTWVELGEQGHRRKPPPSWDQCYATARATRLRLERKGVL